MKASSILAMLCLALTAGACDWREPKVEVEAIPPKIALDVRSRASAAPLVPVIIRLNVGEDFAAVSGPARARTIDLISDRVAAQVPRDDLVEAHRYQIVPIMSAWVSGAGLDALERLPEVRQVVLDREDPPSLDDSITTIEAGNVWPTSKGGGRFVAILDTGSHYLHPFLAGRVKLEACFRKDLKCPNGSSEQKGLGAAVSVGRYHGTHVAGIAAGANGMSGGLNGVAPGADIIAINVSSTRGSFVGDQVKALEYVAGLKATVPVVAANLSFADERAHQVCDAEEPERKLIIDKLLAVGVATVVAAGNNGFTNAVSAPACISSAVTVSSVADNDKMRHNRSDLTDLAAPGVTILSSISHNGSYGNAAADYRRLDGTSMAAPHVSGAIALLSAAVPDAGLNQILKALADTGKVIDDGGKKYRRIDLDDALARLRQQT